MSLLSLFFCCCCFFPFNRKTIESEWGEKSFGTFDATSTHAHTQRNYIRFLFFNEEKTITVTNVFNAIYTPRERYDGSRYTVRSKCSRYCYWRTCVFVPRQYPIDIISCATYAYFRFCTLCRCCQRFVFVFIRSRLRSIVVLQRYSTLFFTPSLSLSFATLKFIYRHSVFGVLPFVVCVCKMYYVA